MEAIKKRFVYLTVEGMEKIVTNQYLYSWHYTILEEGETQPEGSTLIAEFEPVLPQASDCVKPVLDYFKRKEKEIQAEAQADLMRLNERREKLLALPLSGHKDV